MTLSFLEKVVMGEFDSEAFFASGVRVDESKIARIAGKYREIFTKYALPREEEDGTAPAGFLEEMGENGLFGVSIPREYGGLGFNLLEYLRVVEEIVKLDISFAMAFLAHLSIGVKGVELFGTEAQKNRYLSPAASGRMIFSFALTEPKTGSDAQHIETFAQLSEDGRCYILNGRKAYITNANYAGGLTVFAQMKRDRPGFMGGFIVETAWPGVSIGKEMPKMGLKASSTAAIQFRNVRVPVENLLGKPGEGFRIAMTVLNYGRLGLGAASVAAMEASAGDMMRRAAARVQFRVPIKTFPLIQEKIVRARVNAAVASAMKSFAAGELETNPLLNAAVETSHCKLFGTTRAWDAVYDALQVAGGAGYLTTLPFAKRMRDFRVATVFEGTTEIHSFYPALFLIRRLGRETIKKGRGPLASIAGLLRLSLRKTAWPVFEDKAMRNAIRCAKKNARAIRRLLLLGILAHGQKIMAGRAVEQEFFLRRITNISVYLFGLLALLSEAEAKRKAGALSSEDLHVLEYFTIEAEEVRRANNSLADSGRERLNPVIFGDIEGASGPSEAGFGGTG